ncbi:MAG TPA: hypothetical protein VLB32_07530 [Candidatus Acidoferrales bacterium]|nr:hypothetical protein [Candidatus Acidoferrales bacterium]
MKLSVKGMTVAFSLFWGILAMFLAGMGSLVWPGFAHEFLQMMASIYPGYHATASFVDVIVGTLYGLLDGAIGGAVFALLYNRFAG